ncbi:MAG: histidine kinase [Butyrivibrio sp.]|nr:histidine kinase [Butyrivibrio sp.]
MGKINSEKSAPASLSVQVQRVILGIVLVVVTVFLLSGYFIISRERLEYNKSESESVLKTLSSNIKSDIERYKELSRLIKVEDRLVEFLRADVDQVDISMINDARYGIMDILNVTEGVDTVIVIREDMIMLSTNRFTYRYDYDLMNSEYWRKEIYEGKGKVVVSLNTNGIAQKAGNKPMVTIGRAIYDIETQDRTGIMLMNISGTIFDVMLAQLRYNDICILGENGTFIAGNRKYSDYFEESFTGERIVHKDVRISGKRILLSGCKVSGLPLVILRGSDYSVGGTPVRVIIVLVILFVIFLLVAIITGNFVEGLVDTLVEKEKILQKAEMRVLQEQIKPHFLYNSIETIGFMALDAGADKVHDALETMGSFYRNFLSKGGRDIPFSREIRIVKDYLALQKLRYGDIIEDEYDIDEAAENFIVPKLILQPLVENSIYHGIRLKGEAGIIRVTGHIVDGNLHIWVRDTGVGMSREQIDKVLSQDKSDRPTEADSSFGLWGTIERIRIYCGNKDCVKITSEEGEYTEIEIIIPDNTHLGIEE